MNTQAEKTEMKAEHVSLGAQFRQAREALNLSLEEVSKQITLRPAILMQIENNEFIQKNVPATFMKGYVRSYGKFLRLPETLWANLSFGEDEKNDLDKNARATRSVNQYSSHSRWVGYLTALVLLIALSMTGLWWWQNYQQSNEERDTLVQNYVSSSEEEVAPKLASAQSVEQSSIQLNQPNQVIVQPSETSAVSSDTNMVEESNLNSSEVSLQTSSLQKDGLSPKSMTSPELSVNDEGTVIPDTQSAVENPTISPAPPAVQGDLIVEVLKNSSWLSVKDQNRKVLVQKEYKQGEVLTFNGNEFSLIVGAPGNVRITYKGENYPLKVDGRVAKFKLSQP
ncbi:MULTISPECIES: RodZ family helix-turn-helix domain-containing protein [unclassified Pasteurella]|uniref:RodZ domain-containing protein n=1 Tax=unclassified Pasteurella TaxID=2621516 RepID=UPI001074829B|nr:helix-turn-helix domain-containing protein [Pasteurella sp. 19428wF3_WM03]TFU51286.1 helix-turn-helix domain-containing protein [Pasteurella sp. WM03]